YQRARYEAEKIYGLPFDGRVMDRYVMPEFRARIGEILDREESPETTARWNRILRDIMFSAVNEDFATAEREGVSLRTAGFRDSQLRVLTALLAPLPREERERLTLPLPEATRRLLGEYGKHPEAELYT
ncbi:MAG: hypothetical protein JXA95_04290, partial [Spirochaetales bacterium]|nr:hypothetical protein [Spirochaetales bacterium]